MENTNRDTANNAAPQTDWRNAERDDERLHAMQATPDDDDDDDNEEEEEEESKDWGHTDPSDSPFPDSNDPSGPGSAV